MEKRLLGKTGMSVSVLGFGGAEVGFLNAPLADVQRLLGSALDSGLNVIDTAECYATSEELIGESVSARRKHYYLFTKCGHSRGYATPDWEDIPRLKDSLDRSLQRLRTDHLDLFQLHSCSREILMKGEVMDFIVRAKESGKTRFIGYSGENDDALYAINTGVFDTLQTSVSIADQRGITVVLPEATKRQMGIIAKRPIANAVWKHTAPPEAYHFEYWERLNALRYEFIEKNPKDAAATALRFTLSVPGVSVAIVGTKQPGRWEENARAAAEGRLDAADYNAIRERWNEVAVPDWTGEV